ncbi:hypothetical protein HUJ04_012144 [Dendroctonus ponderosae]|uniref:C2H2-type domain-containing protein n=1 Tax=Dendroctonus ponderosae TaxID=77166 RepID=A0AAR5NZ88_DENPD|nr:hypothetical protein HUJ04_012144 [Dendroctonus ponderosae]
MMVVLESASAMLAAASNQYLQPDYMGSSSGTPDSKTSPLALLAQTCSQIGADSPTSKPLLSTLEKKKSESRTSPVSTRSGKTSQRSTPSDSGAKLAFKPYESTVVTKRVDSADNGKKSPSDRKSASPSAQSGGSHTPGASDCEKPASETKQKDVTTPSASPIIRSGLEMIQGHPKEHLSAYKNMSAALPAHLGSMYCPPGLEHPAYRPTFPGVSYPHHHNMLGYPGAAPTPYLSYARVKTPSGSEALVPVCKDAYCTGSQYSLPPNQPLMMAGGAPDPCPSGCTQCDHQKYSMAMSMSLGAQNSLPYPRLYVCSWIAGDSYCGKRFVTSDELYQHLRSHASTSDPSTSSAASLLNHSLLASARSAYSSALSPLSPRYNPYAKPGLPTSLAPSHYSAFNPASLGSYYSSYPLSFYGIQRLGSAAVHP